MCQLFIGASNCLNGPGEGKPKGSKQNKYGLAVLLAAQQVMPLPMAKLPTVRTAGLLAGKIVKPVISRPGIVSTS